MKNTQLVYSTDKGKCCPQCEQPIAQCHCKTTKQYCGDDVVRISHETKGRKGKGVTLITGIAGTDSEIKAIAKKLKQACNCGGASKNGVIEIQGDHRERISSLLKDQGFIVKKS